MADIIDKANELQEHFDSLRIENARQQAKQRDAEAVGHCLNCGKQTHEPGRRWCNASCRDDWEKLSKKGI